MKMMATNRRYTENTDNLTQLSNRLGTGISVFQALSNLSINSIFALNLSHIICL